MYCQKCGKILSDDAGFCDFCGHIVIRNPGQGKQEPYQPFTMPVQAEQLPSSHNIPMSEYVTVPVTQQPSMEKAEQKAVELPPQGSRESVSPPVQEIPPVQKPEEKKQIPFIPVLLGVLVFMAMLLFSGQQKKDVKPRLPEETQAPTEVSQPQEVVTQEKWDFTGMEIQGQPGGKTLFCDNFLYLSKEQLLERYEELLRVNEIQLEIGEATGLEKLHHYLYRGGMECGYIAFATDAQGNITQVTQALYRGKDESTYGDKLKAGFLMYAAGHGDLTQEHWRNIQNAKPATVKPEYIYYKYDLDGLKAVMTIWPDEFFFMIQVG